MRSYISFSHSQIVDSDVFARYQAAASAELLEPVLTSEQTSHGTRIVIKGLFADLESACAFWQAVYPAEQPDEVRTFSATPLNGAVLAEITEASGAYSIVNS